VKSALKGASFDPFFDNIQHENTKRKGKKGG